jgi:hypothetical protein
MTYPSAEEFEQLLLTDPIDDLVINHILTGVPYIFREDGNAATVLTEHLAAALGKLPGSIQVVGSGRLGFSLNPKNFKRPFSDASDLDVAVIDEELFDSVWHTLLEWNYMRRHKLPKPEWKWLKTRQSELYWGWLRPERLSRHEGLLFPEILKPIRDFATLWFNAFRSLGQTRTFASRNVSGRLYRSHEHARLYHRHGLQLLKAEIERT